MKLLVLSGLLLTAALILTGCASPGAYLVGRGHDARDIFTATVGVGAGAKARVGPVHAGILLHHDVAGIRDSAIGCYTLSMGKGDGVALEYEAAFIPVPGAYREGMLGNWAFGYDAFMSRAVEGRRLKADYEVRSLVPFVATSGIRPHYYTQLEVVAALGPGVRLGFNPGELVDFILGWAAIDLFDDDLDQGSTEHPNAAYPVSANGPSE